MKFQYSVVRVVPSPIAEECLNVAVILTDGGRVMLRRAKKLDRIARAFPGIDPQAIALSLAHLDELGQTDLGELWRSTRGALVRVSKPATTVGANMDSEVNELLELFVEPGPLAAAAYQPGPRSRRRVAANGAGV